jgi:cytochrome c oxidase cbb3-type subunit III
MFLVCLGCERGRGTDATDSVPVADPAARARGKVTYMTYCVLCHGERGDGHGVRRSNLSSAPRDFTDPTWLKRTTPSSTFLAIKDGVAETPMPAWRGALDDAAIWDVVAYVRSLGEAGR